MLLWASAALLYFPILPPWVGVIASVVVVTMPCWIARFVVPPEQRRSFLFLTSFGVMLVWLLIPPATDRDWDTAHDRIAIPEISESRISIKDVRAFRYTSNGHGNVPDQTESYFDLEIDLEQIEGMDIAIADLTAWRGPAHTMISFSYRDGNRLRYLNVSAETRREAGESYNPIRGLFKQFELVYVIADEMDALGLRHVYDEQVRLYPVALPKETIQQIFLEVMHRAKKLQSQPEFYHTITNNCTTQILNHIADVTGVDISILNWRILMASHSCDLLFQHNVVDTKLSPAEARVQFLTNQRAKSFVEGTDFSQHIRPGPVETQP